MNKNTSIWILEDDAGCRFVYEQVLAIRYQLTFFDNIAEFNTAIRSQETRKPDLIIADLCLTDGFFLSVGKESQHKENLPNTPFIIISSMDDIDVLRHCFQSGAHDYLTKPFQKAELIVKIERILLKKNQTKAVTDATKYYDSVFSGLTQKEQKIFKLFLNEENKQVCRSNILSHIWGTTKIDPKTVDVHLYNLRKKLEVHGIEIKLIGASSWVMSDNRMNESTAEQLRI